MEFIQFGTFSASTYDVFKNGVKAVLALKTKGRRSSISQYRAKQQVGLSFFTVSINGQGKAKQLNKQWVC